MLAVQNSGVTVHTASAPVVPAVLLLLLLLLLLPAPVLQCTSAQRQPHTAAAAVAPDVHCMRLTVLQLCSAMLLLKETGCSPTAPCPLM
jgi:hypothetical protein